MTKDIWIRYTELLRRAWLNPSYKPWTEEVCAFENEHYDDLEKYFVEWQKNTIEQKFSHFD